MVWDTWSAWWITPRALAMGNMAQKHPRSPHIVLGKFLTPFVHWLKACGAFVDSFSKTKLWDCVKTIAALIVILAALAFSCWLNIYWCFGWC